MTEHWNGTTWHATPNPATACCGITSLSGNKESGIWAADAGGNLYHWVSGAWTLVYTPSGIGGDSLGYVVAFSPTEVWELWDTYHRRDGTLAVKAIHWNGTQARVYTLPADPGTTLPYAIGGDSPSDIWVVGRTNVSHNGTKSYAVHFDGKTWSLQDPPYHGGNHELNAIAATSPTDVWAVGSTWVAGVREPLEEHWNGTRWTKHEGPDLTTAAELLGVTAIPGTSDFWAIGASFPRPNQEFFKTLALHCCG